jgi:transcriptional regulator with XRE-family HTH domain
MEITGGFPVPHKMEDFGKTLERLRKSKGLKTQQQLGKAAKLSRTYISTLEGLKASDKKRPSSEALRELCLVLATEGERVDKKTPLDRKKAFELIFSALGLDIGDPFAEEKGSAGPALKELLQNSKEAWVFTDILAENISDEVLAIVIEHGLKRGVEFRYFLSDPSQWPKCEERFRARLKANWEQCKKQIMVIECLSPLCEMHVGIYDPGQRSAQGTVTVGPVNQAKFESLQPEQVFAISKKVVPVFSDLVSSDHEIVDPSLGRLRLIFPKEGFA